MLDGWERGLVIGRVEREEREGRGEKRELLLLPFAFEREHLEFHSQKVHLYSRNRCHCYYNYFVLVVFLQIANLEE